MNISIVTSFPFPGGHATANRINVFASILAKSKKIKSVEIICTSDKYKPTFFLDKKIKVTCLKVNEVNKNSLFIRFFHELLIAYKLSLNSKKSKPDLIIFSVPSIMLLIPMIFNIKKNFIVLDIRDAVWT